MVDFEKRAPLNILKIGPGMVLGLLLIIGGTLLFVDNLDFLPFRTAGLFWPLVFIVGGAATLLNTRSTVQVVWSSTAMVAGTLLGLGNFHVLHISFGALWPLALIASGIVMLIYRFRWVGVTDRFRCQIGANANSRIVENRISEYAVFSAVKRKIETQSFEGGEISGLFGGVEIDLRRAGISLPGKVAVIEANAAFGGIEIRIPETWRVIIQGTAVFGAYEDKTIPPRPEPGIDIPTLVIRGGTAFGAVTIQN